MEYSYRPRFNASLVSVTPSITLVTSEHLFNTTPSLMGAGGSGADESPAYVVMRRLHTVLIPVICVLGIIGNVLAAGTFLSPGLCKTSCCFYLASKSLNDIGFLVSLFIVWLSTLRVSLFTTPGVCQITVFLTYVCSCLSVWFVVFITAENFVRLTQPRLVPRYCNVVMARRIVAGSVVTTALLYNFSLWTTGVTESVMGKSCSSLSNFEKIVMTLTVIDTTMTLIVPTIIMFFLLVAIVFKSMESFERKKRLRSSSLQNSSQKKQKKRLTPEGKMTTFLFVLSIIFLFLNLPTHAIRLKFLIQTLIHELPLSYTDRILHRVFEILLYFNFSTNCLIYLLFGERFRVVFKSKYLARCCPKKDQITEGDDSKDMTEAVTLPLHKRNGAIKNESASMTCVTDFNGAENV